VAAVLNWLVVEAVPLKLKKKKKKSGIRFRCYIIDE